MVVDGVVVVAVVVTIIVAVVVVVFVSRVVVYLMMLVNKPRPDHFQVSQTEFVQFIVSRCNRTVFTNLTRSVAAGFGRHGMPLPASNDTGTALGQDGSD